ncbi:ABC transporter E family member 2, partial [Tanacetum coccineum]
MCKENKMREAFKVSYKPQRVRTNFNGSVRSYLKKGIPDIHDSQFVSDVIKPLEIEELMDRETGTAFVVDHDLLMATYLADRVIVYEGTPSIDCVANAPQSLLTGMNLFLSNLILVMEFEKVCVIDENGLKTFFPLGGNIENSDCPGECRAKKGGQHWAQTVLGYPSILIIRREQAAVCSLKLEGCCRGVHQGGSFRLLLDFDEQEDGYLHSKRVCIKTTLVDNIYESFKVIIQGKTFWIRAKEVSGLMPDFEEDIDQDSKSDDELSNEGSFDENGGLRITPNVEGESDLEEVAETIFEKVPLDGCKFTQ